MEKIDPTPNWEPGDIALCIRGGVIAPGNPLYKGDFPSAGKPYKVQAVDRRTTYQSRKEPILLLQLEDGPPNLSRDRKWAAYRFIKVTPPEDMEEVEEFKKVEELV